MGEQPVQDVLDLASRRSHPVVQFGPMNRPISTATKLTMNVVAQVGVCDDTDLDEGTVQHLARENASKDFRSRQVEVRSRRRIASDPVGSRKIVVIVTATAAANCQRNSKRISTSAGPTNTLL